MAVRKQHVVIRRPQRQQRENAVCAHGTRLKLAKLGLRAKPVVMDACPCAGTCDSTARRHCLSRLRGCSTKEVIIWRQKASCDRGDDVASTTLHDATYLRQRVLGAFGPQGHGRNTSHTDTSPSASFRGRTRSGGPQKSTGTGKSSCDTENIGAEFV